MNDNTLQGRVIMRLEKLNMNIAEAERKGGFSHTYIHDIVSGKKKAVREKQQEKLAAVLQTNRMWLFSGRGNEEDADFQPPAGAGPLPQPQAVTPTHGLRGRFTIAADAQVSDVEVIAMRVALIDTATGRFVGVADGDADQTINGSILDPEFALYNNAYVGAALEADVRDFYVKWVHNPGEQPQCVILSMKKDA